MMRRIAILAGLGAAVLFAWPTLAALSSVAGLFEAGRYDEARDALGAGGQGARPGEDVLWQSRLAGTPATALSLLESGLEDSKLDPAVLTRMALEAADLHAGRGEHRAVMRVLTPVLNGEETEIPGAVYLRAGLSLRALGRLQQAREMLASVRPGDPAFVLARYYLGDIGLEQNDAALALRYFKAATKATDRPGQSRLAAGLWLAHRTTGQEKEADELFQRLSAEDPGSLALLEIRRLLQVEADERNARRKTAPADSVVTPVVDTSGRYALQLGAFSDRGLALEFVKRYHDRLPDLRIDKSRDSRGQFLYKVRTGNYVNPALARSQAKQLQQKLGIEVIVADLAVGGASSR